MCCHPDVCASAASRMHTSLLLCDSESRESLTPIQQARGRRWAAWQQQLQVSCTEQECSVCCACLRSAPAFTSEVAVRVAAACMRPAQQHVHSACRHVLHGHAHNTVSRLIHLGGGERGGGRGGGDGGGDGGGLHVQAQQCSVMHACVVAKHARLALVAAHLGGGGDGGGGDGGLLSAHTGSCRTLEGGTPQLPNQSRFHLLPRWLERVMSQLA